MLYPLKFKTIFKEKIWGGQKIKTYLGKDFNPLHNCGETWELSGVEGNVSIVKEGDFQGKKISSLIEQFKDSLLGNKIYRKYKNEFPLLVKFIDAREDLSIQVHPDDTLAKERHNSPGKTEMWYIIQADEGAKLITGFNQPVTREQYLETFQQGRIKEILNIEKVYSDDVFYIPAGRVHTIGKGILLAEIQQSSDVTYRIYDFDRIDSNGNKRELHVEQAQDAIDYNYYDHYKTNYNKSLSNVNLVDQKYFTTNKIRLHGKDEKDFSAIDSFVVYICIEGSFSLGFENKRIFGKKGEVVLVPACIKKYELTSGVGCTLLETYIS